MSLRPSWRRLESRWDDVGSWRVHSRVASTSPRGAPLVVLVHGLGVSSRYLAPTALALDRRGLEVALPDLPGYGLTRAGDHLGISGLAGALGGWLDAVHPERRPALLANSFGCQIVADLAAREPDRVAALVLVGPTVDRRARTTAAQVVRWVRNAPREPLGLGAIIAADYLACGLVRPAVAFRSALRDAIESTLARVAVPTLLVRGERDPIAPRRWLDELAGHAVDARVAELPGVAHTANFTAPEALADEVVAFLAAGRGGDQASG